MECSLQHSFHKLSERITGVDCTSKLFMSLIYGLYTGMHIDFGAVLWAQVIQRTISTSQYIEISCARFWSLIVCRAIEKHNIPTMQDALSFSVSTFHTTGIIVANTSKFSFIGSIPEVMFWEVPASTIILDRFHKLTPSGFRPLTPEMKETLDAADKLKKGGKGSNKGVKKRRKQPSHKRKTPTPSPIEALDSETESDIRIDDNQPIRNEEEEPACTRVSTVNPEPFVHTTEDITNPEVNQSVPYPHPSPKTTTTPNTISPCASPVTVGLMSKSITIVVTSSQLTTIPCSTPILSASTAPPIISTNPEATINVFDTRATTSFFSTFVSSSICLIRNDDPDMIFRDEDADDDLAGFTYSPFQIRTESEDEATVSKAQLKAIHEKLDQLVLASKASSSDA
ncbi:unnamed protein product [Lactuca saligna]|uniref:Uncharacterized protein n=1 Tax=Lactuca saligna TaxID=75948 RepID=A0AA35YYS5_LACSI|nr:unnamed protein product [Lactuca saligna]